MKAYLDTSPWVKENYLVPLPWRPVELPSKLKIAVMWSDDIVRPHPPIQRALSMVFQALKSHPEFDIVDWAPLDHDKCWKLTCALYWEDGGRRLKEVLASGGEEALPLTKWLLEQEEMKPRTIEEVWAVSSYISLHSEQRLITRCEC